ncbi:MAG: hypothetical protein MJ211_00940 [Bacteroidales bacterium]|nr:hypothetical protein [Bacteroidales bacterium]
MNKRNTQVIEIERLFSENLQKIEMFLQREKHFPFCIVSNIEELKLHNWWNDINKFYDILSNEHKTEIQRIKHIYSDLTSKKSDYKWLENFKSMYEYVRMYNELPLSVSSKQWYFLNKKKYETNTLPQSRIENFKKLYDIVEEILKNDLAYQYFKNRYEKRHQPKRRVEYIDSIVIKRFEDRIR